MNKESILKLIWAVRVSWVDILLAAMLLLVAIPVALSHESLDKWYQSLQTIDGTSCCNMQDCASTDARLRDGQWEVQVQHAWLPVPSDRVLRRENPDGRPVVCIRDGTVICFVPPAGA